MRVSDRLSLQSFILTSVPTKKVKQPLSVTHPELAKEADGWDPGILQPVGKIVEWRCSLDHTYLTRIYDRIRGRNCAVCTGKQIQIGVNDLANTHPDLALQAHLWDPRGVTAGSHQRKEWVCTQGHLTISTIKNRALLGNDCAVCTNQEVLAGYNDLASQYPDIANQALGWDPSTVISGSKIKRDWMCPFGHTYSSSPGQRVRGSGCSVCAGKKILIGFNDLLSTHPEVAEEAHNWNPKEVMAGTHVKKEFKCPQEHIYRAVVKDRTGSKSGCPICSKHGFNPGKAGFLYFLEQPEWEMFQIGVTNNLDQRLKIHTDRGWQAIEIRGPMEGLLAINWETAILRMLKARGADLSNNKIAGKFDGYSEAWSKSTFEVKSIKELMRLTEEYEDK